MPDINAIVGRMLDAGESEEDIAAVIQHYKKGQPAGTVAASEPDTFWGGVKKSLSGGLSSDVAKASGRGLLGYAKGAIADLPGSIMGALSSVGDAIADPAKLASQTLDVASHLPSDLMAAGKQGYSALADATSKAGSDPESFGRMMGQVTGQPLATEGVLRGLGAAKAPVGRGLETVGRGIQNPKFTSTVGKAAGTAVGGHMGGPVGAMAGYGMGSAAEPALRGIGRGIEKLGKNMSTPLIDAEVIPAGARPGGFTEGVYTDIPKRKTGLPASDTIYPPQPERLGLSRAMESEPMNIPGTKAGPNVSTGPFEMPESNIPNTRNAASRGGRIDTGPSREPVPPNFITDNPRGRPGARTEWKPFSGHSAKTAMPEELALDSRISGLPPEELPRQPLQPVPNMGSGGTLMDQLKLEAQRYGMSLTDYISSLRSNAGSNFVMPSAQLPRVR